jgi:CubicO group peptidase (beta-lactamase class C family)
MQLRTARSTAMIFACIGLLGARLAAGQDVDPSLEQLKQGLREAMAETRTPGMAVALVGPAGVIDRFGIGLADVDGNIPATADTLFRIASVSKIFVAMAALRLAVDGRLDLSAPLSRAAPQIRFDNAREASDPVRLMHLLGHTSGFEDLAPGPPTSRWRPGERYGYTNRGPAMVAQVIERITGEGFDAHVRRTLFTPLGMLRTTYAQPAPGVPVATLYRDNGHTPVAYQDFQEWPSIALNSSASDMARLLQLLLARGLVDGSRLVDATVFDQMEHGNRWLGTEVGLSAAAGLGLRAFAFGGTCHGHDGIVQGGAALLIYCPTQHIGMAVMTNSGSAAMISRASALIRKFLVPPGPAAVRPIAQLATGLPEAFAGYYIPASSRGRKDALDDRPRGIMYLRRAQQGMLALNLPRGSATRYVARAARILRSERGAWPEIALLPVQLDGRRALLRGEQAFVQTSALIAIGPLLLFWAALVGSIGGVLIPAAGALSGRWRVRDRLW